MGPLGEISAGTTGRLPVGYQEVFRGGCWPSLLAYSPPVLLAYSPSINKCCDVGVCVGLSDSLDGLLPWNLFPKLVRGSGMVL